MSSFNNFPQFVKIHTIKDFSIVNEAEVDAFLEFPCFFYDPMSVGSLISDPACTLLHLDVLNSHTVEA